MYTPPEEGRAPVKVRAVVLLPVLEDEEKVTVGLVTDVVTVVNGVEVFEFDDTLEITVLRVDRSNTVGRSLPVM